mgnify:FL=1
MSETQIRRSEVAAAILKNVGGAENVSELTACFTRLRFILKDTSKLDAVSLRNSPGVVSLVEAGGQTQVVVGTEASAIRDEVERLLQSDDREAVGEPGSGNLFDRFIALVSALFTPFLWVLAGTGLLKALLSLSSTLGLVDASSTTYTILNAATDSLFYYLPMFLAFTAAKRFNANPYLSLALAGALLHPSLIALATAGSPVNFLGIPVVMETYTSSVLPIILIVWVQSRIEPWLGRVLPKAVGTFLTPALILLVLFPVALMTIGPATAYVSQWIAAGISWLFTVSPAIAGFTLGGLAQVMVVFGVNWALIGVIINEFATTGQSFLAIPIFPALTAQVGAAFAVFLRTRDPKMKQVSGPAALSGFLAGISEPIIYGVNLPLRRPFILGCVSGAVGGAIASASGVAAMGFAVPSLMTMPIALGSSGNFPMFVAAVVGAMLLAFTLTFFFGVKRADKNGQVSSDEGARGRSANPAGARPTRVVLAPVGGECYELERVPDQVFASGAMGAGAALRPATGDLVSPVDGVVIASMPHAYGLRTDDGVEVLIHIGFDTVKMDQALFTPLVAADDRVRAGERLGVFDLDAVIAAGVDPTVVVTLTNAAELGRVTPIPPGPVSPGAPLIHVGT